MPRDASGNYTLPAGNPVEGGTTIEATWANPTLADVAQTLTDSLDRNGNGGMNVAIQYSDGTKTAPGIAWTNEPSSGFRRAGQFDQRTVISATDVTRHIQSAEPVGQQHPHSIWDGTAFKNTLLGVGGAEAPTFQQANWNNLTVGGSLTVNDKLAEGPLVINGDDQYAWGHVVGATGTLTNALNATSVSRFNPGVYRINLNQPFGTRLGCVLFGIEDSSPAGSWFEWVEDGNNQILVLTGTSAGVNADANFSFLAMLDYSPPAS